MRQAFVRELFCGNSDVGSGTEYPQLSRGRAQQIGPLFSHLRRTGPRPSALETLRELDLLVHPASWPTLLVSRTIQQLASVDMSAALSLTAQMALGLRLIKMFSTETQFRELARSPAPVFAFGLTESSPGSDVSQIQTFAEPTGGGGYRLSGVKSWVTNATFATHFLVFARTTPPGAGNKPRLTAFIVPLGPGVSVRPVESEVLPGAGVGELHLDRAVVSDADVLGQVGKGFRIVMAGLSEARLFLGAAATGACVRAFNDTIERLNERRAFGRAVGNFPSVQDRTAGMLADVLSLESLVNAVAGLEATPSRTDAVERAVVRLSASKTSGRVLDAARELFGAAAFVGSATAARRWMDTRALTLLDGSDLALESYIVLEGTREIRHGLENADGALHQLARVDAVGSQAIARLRSRVRRAFVRDVPGASSPLLASFVGDLGNHVQRELRAHGADIVERQHVQRRLASIVAELATWEALSSRVSAEIEKHGTVGAARMIEATEIWVASATTRLQAQFESLRKNDDTLRDRIANRAYTDGAYPFDII